MIAFAFRRMLRFAVVLISALLACVPAHADVYEKPDRASARNDVVQIATAIVAFETEYGRLPETKGRVVGGDFLAALLGQNDALNPRKIVFIDVQNAKKGKSGLRDGVFVDPWGAPYKVVMDEDGDGIILTAGEAPGPVTLNLKKKVAVWNAPALHQDNPDPLEQKRRAVVSWQ
jgi:hypothetical protein